MNSATCLERSSDCGELQQIMPLARVQQTSQHLLALQAAANSLVLSFSLLLVQGGWNSCHRISYTQKIWVMTLCYLFFYQERKKVQ